jgi:hypothetical protein
MTKSVGKAALLFALLLVGFKLSAALAEEPSVLKIVKTDERPPYKISYDVTLRERVDKATLERIARQIWRPGYELTFIGYRLDSQSVDSAYWATTHWDGDKVAVVVSGLEKGQVEKLQAEKPPDTPKGAKTMGRWLSLHAAGGHFVLYRLKGKMFLLQRYPDGTLSTDEVFDKPHRSVRALRIAGTSDYWVITTTGQLEAWDSDGKVGWFRAQRLP